MSALKNPLRLGFLGRALAVLGAANAAASVVEGHRRPRDRDLRVLGIDPENFNTVNRG